MISGGNKLSEEREEPTQHNNTTLEMPCTTLPNIGPFVCAQPFLQRYDLRICLHGRKGQEYSEWEALTAFLSKLQAIDHTIKVYPWQARDHPENPAIELASAPHDFFNLETYAPRLVCQQAGWKSRAQSGSTRHPYLFMGSSVPPPHLVAAMGPWLCATKQGLWPRQIPLAEQTLCIGWLLFSAPEYDLDDIR